MKDTHSKTLPTSALVVGFGSIGKRHAECLRDLGIKAGVLSQRSDIADFPAYTSLAQALNSTNPQLVIVANETSKHLQTLEELNTLGFNGKILLEKPATSEPVERNATKLTSSDFERTFVAYCLRAHPGVRALVGAIRGAKVYSAHLYAGGYLPNWRPNRDYRDTYSAKAELGGGVLRDLSHELDLLCLLTGEWRSVVATLGHRSTLEISSEDVCSMLIKTKECEQCMVEINYLHQKDGRRDVVLQTSNGTFELCLTPLSLRHNGQTIEVKSLSDSMYHEQLRFVLEGRSGELCSLSEGLQIVDLIAAAERSNKESRWVQHQA